MSRTKPAETPVETKLLVVFSDLTSFARTTMSMKPLDLFAMMSESSEQVGDLISPAGGKVVKFIGDAFLAVFPADRADDGVKALLDLREKGDAWFAQRNLQCRHVIKAHLGDVACGLIGTRGDKRFDVYGIAVNVAAMMKSGGFAISPEAFRALSPLTRKAFKKHTPPVVYIPGEDDRRRY